MVVIFLPAASLSEVWQDRTASPFRCTVQAPHRPAPQPNFVPVICNCSRMAHSSGVSGAASTDIFRPLTLRLGMSLPLPVHDAAYGGNSLLAGGRTSTGPMSTLRERMIAFQCRGNGNWNRLRKRKFLTGRCALRQHVVQRVVEQYCWLRQAAIPARRTWPVPTAEWIAPESSRAARSLRSGDATNQPRRE